MMRRASRLTLDDVNWVDGTVRIYSPKRRRSERLLPSRDDVGAVLAKYVMHARLRTRSHTRWRILAAARASLFVRI